MVRESMPRKFNIRWQLMFYDVMVYVVVTAFIVTTYGLAGGSRQEFAMGSFAALAALLICRTVGKVYSMIIRYGGVHVYMRLFATDFFVLLGYFPIKYGLGLTHMTSQRWLIIVLLNLLGAVGMRLMYRYCYRFGVRRTKKGQFLRWLLVLFAGDNVIKERRNEHKRIRVAILGAGRLGAVLADELLSNDNAAYVPVCFIDQDETKAGREVMGLPVLPEGEDGLEDLKDYGVQEIVFAITNIINTKKDGLFKLYKAAGYKVKVYDFSVADVAKSGKRILREFDIDELLFRQPIVVNNELVHSYYKDKVILVTGGGGSIGSEMCRQVAKMEPKQVIALDIYENGVYDLQQELRLLYGAKLDFKVEIASICSRSAMARVMEEYHPNIVIHAAAHKHVPLMEKNCIEAVENNVFGTLNVIELCEEYGVGRFMMVSTDKAVNPTNIMGATKRMCEIIARAHSAQKGNKVVFSDTRFGNVLGSAGSVIPLFKRQIANGGPITITDKRIIRYFMTIPEASQLVLHSGAIAKNGELFVLDMGQPIKILDLAENMIKLSGLVPYKDIDIVETGLRPGEKLYEELLVKSETLHTTNNDLIFIEKDEPISMEELNLRLDALREAMLREPDYYLGVVGANLGQTMGNIISKSYELMSNTKPDAVIVLGDTNSCLSVLAAKRLKIPIFHMEAGNRCKDENLPEEVIRRIVDVTSDVNLCYSEHARKYILDSGVKPEYTYVVGSPMAEVLNNNKVMIEHSNVLKELSLKKGEYILLSAHREENIDLENNFFSLMSSINSMAKKYKMPIIYSCHPRAEKYIKLRNFKFHENVTQHKPLGFFDYNKLQQNAFCVVSDSGTLPEEAAYFKFPAVSIRTSTERPEAMDKGVFIIGSISSNQVLQAVDLAVNMHKNGDNAVDVPAYIDNNISSKVIKIIQSYTGIINTKIWRK